MSFPQVSYLESLEKEARTRVSQRVQRTGEKFAWPGERGASSILFDRESAEI